jgi:hypothetical protein
VVLQHLAAVGTHAVEYEGARHAEVDYAGNKSGHADVVALDISVDYPVVVQEGDAAKNL